jgi:glutathione synthase/RimK-type ligase-like ATP-grasp enzyme
MSIYILRRRKLGRTSAREIARFSNKIDGAVRNDRPWPSPPTMVIRWGCTTDVPNGVTIINKSSAIHEVNDKSEFRKKLFEHYLDTDMRIVPDSFFGDDYDEQDFPLVVRPRVHAQGRRLYLVLNHQEMNNAIQRCGPGWYASKFINKVAEYRVTFVQGRVAWVARKTPGNPQAVAWNVALGGRFDNVSWSDWPLKAVKVAREAFLLSSLDFGAVDVMVDAEGVPYVLEINSAPSQTSPYRQECMAKCFDYLIEHGADRIPVTTEKGGWKKFIHPALSEEAVLV